MVADARVDMAKFRERSATNTQKDYNYIYNLFGSTTYSFSFGTPYEFWIIIFIKSIYLKTTSNRYYLRVTVLATQEQAIMSDNKTQDFLQQLLLKSDTLDAKLTNIGKSLKFEIPEIKKNFDTFKTKNYEELAQLKVTIKSLEESQQRINNKYDE